MSESFRISARRALRTTGVAVITGAMLPTFAARTAMADHHQRSALRDRWVKRWSLALLRLFAIELAIENFPEPQTPGRGRLVVANHRSTIDICILLRTFGGHLLSRADLSNWPLVGTAARSVGTVFVDRGDRVSGANAIRAIRALLKEGGTVSIFPEGTTFAGDEVHPFHAGAFVAALHTNAEIVPVGIAYELGSQTAFVNEPFLAHLGRLASAPPTRVAVTVGDAIDVLRGAKAGDLRDHAHTAIEKLVRRSRAKL